MRLLSKHIFETVVRDLRMRAATSELSRANPALRLIRSPALRGVPRGSKLSRASHNLKHLFTYLHCQYWQRSSS
jgi:hypothetical protein